MITYAEFLKKKYKGFDINNPKDNQGILDLVDVRNDELKLECDMFNRYCMNNNYIGVILNLLKKDIKNNNYKNKTLLHYVDIVNKSIIKDYDKLFWTETLEYEHNITNHGINHGMSIYRVDEVVMYFQKDCFLIQVLKPLSNIFYIPKKYYRKYAEAVKYQEDDIRLYKEKLGYMFFEDYDPFAIQMVLNS